MKAAANTDFEVPEAQHLVPVSAKDEILTDDEKIKQIHFHFARIMQVMGLDLNEHSLRETPARVAKMFVTEIFSGLNPENFPEISLFDNLYNYKGILIEKNIQLYSYCEHHFVPFIGKAHVAYIPGGKVIGLSKINRLVQYFSRRPQVQERLTNDIAESLKSVLNIEDVAVYIEATHLCVASRGVRDTHSTTVTTYFGGHFQHREGQEDFYASFNERL